VSSGKLKGVLILSVPCKGQLIPAAVNNAPKDRWKAPWYFPDFDC
jgi:hypothetical protein